MIMLDGMARLDGGSSTILFLSGQTEPARPDTIDYLKQHC